MSRPAPGPVCALYVPGDRPERFAKAAVSGADLVVIDLEDAVAPAAKAAAREYAADYLTGSTSSIPVALRINSRRSEAFADDMSLLRQLAGSGRLPAEVRVPKVESPADVADVAGIPGIAIAALIETARGLVAVHEIAAAKGIVSIGLGESDLRSELMVDGDIGMAHPRSVLVIAAAAAGLRAPALAAYPDLPDLDGLAGSCAAGRALGCYGRTAIHPSQVAVIRHAFAPTASEIRAAQDIIARLDAGRRSDHGAVRTDSGAMADPAMRGWAETILARAYRRG